jgi:hypothetical protein
MEFDFEREEEKEKYLKKYHQDKATHFKNDN